MSETPSPHRGTRAHTGVSEKPGDVYDDSAARQAREELERREERFRSLTKLSSDWYWETDIEGRFTFISDGIFQTFGVGTEFFLGKARHQLKGGPLGGLEPYQRALEAREPFFEVRYTARRPHDSEPLHLLISGEPVFEKGEFVGYRGIGRDITDEINAAQRMATLAEENAALIENSLDVIALLDQEGRFIRLNRALREVLGYEPAECLGRRYQDFLDPTELKLTQQLDVFLRSGHEVIRNLETRWRRKDGATATLSLSLRWSAKQKLMYVTARDVTVARATQAELEQSKDRLASIIEGIGDAFFSVDENWIVTYLNEKSARFVGRPRSDLLGRVLWEAVPEILDSSVLQYYQDAMSSRTPMTFEEFYHPAQAWLEVRVYPLEKGIAVYFHDISTRREAEEAIRESERRHRMMIELTPAAYLYTDEQGLMVDVNPALCAITGYARHELLGQPLSHVFRYCPWEGVAFAPNGPRSAHGMDATLAHRNGHDIPVLLNASIERDLAGAAVRLTAFLTDITERKQVETRLEYLANHDALTGLPNRAALMHRAGGMLNPTGCEVAVIFLDLDRFKEVNDSFGHEPGDRLLREVGRRLRANLRPDDFVARLGGDEFVVVAPCSSGRSGAQAIANKLLAALAEPVDIGEQAVYVSASIGVSMYPEDGSSIEVLFQNADTAMYRAKGAGRNCLCFFEEEMSQAAKMRMALDLSLRQALPRNEFRLEFQPRIRLDKMGISGFEALLRWAHPELGLVNPAAFVPIAESNGLIDSIGTWVLGAACEQAAQLRARFGREYKVSVNVSAVQLKNPCIVGVVSSVLTRHDLPPSALELELTETTLIEDVEQTARVLCELKALGVRLSVDDFGTGYSSLAYLRRFPLDVLKLDRSFILSEQAKDDAGFIKAFVDLAHALNLAVVAEGVESEQTLALLRAAHCDEAQGFLIARPMESEKLLRYLGDFLHGQRR